MTMSQSASLVSEVVSKGVFEVNALDSGHTLKDKPVSAKRVCGWITCPGAVNSVPNADHD